MNRLDAGPTSTAGKSRSMRMAAAILCAVMVLLSHGVCHAWHTLTHPFITGLAFAHLPYDIKERLTPYVSTLMWGSMAPDLALRDWNNHEWNVHGEEDRHGSAPARIGELSASVLEALQRDPPDLEEAASDLGLLSHYLADLSQPLHTDEWAESEDGMHVAYEEDVLSQQAGFVYAPRGTTFRFDPSECARKSALKANRHYHAVIDAYDSGRGYMDVQRITEIQLGNAVDDILDLWTTLWRSALSDGPSLALHSERKVYTPGDLLSVAVSTLPGKRGRVATDLYLAIVSDGWGAWFLGPGPAFFKTPVPLWKSRIISEISGENVLSVPLGMNAPEGKFTIYAILVSAGCSPFEPQCWLSDVETLRFGIEPLDDFPFEELADEEYLFPAHLPDANETVALPLRRWDFIILGDQKDSPVTPWDDTLTDALIPGRFNHLLVYLGRAGDGRPYGFEMTTDLLLEGPDLRVVRFPEFEETDPELEFLNLPVMMKNIRRYRARWALRLESGEMSKLKGAQEAVLRQIREDWMSGFPYQIEYDWSGRLDDKAVYLVDDGRKRGASCTDYWLSLLEDYGGVCIHGSRITAAEIEDYFRNDPQGSTALVPEPLNPFSFDLTASEVFDFGFFPVDPLPHVFRCDNSTETGLPIPDRLLKSPQLVDVEPVPLPPEWSSE